MWTAVLNLKIKQPKKSNGTSSKVTAMGLVSVRPYNEGVRKNARSTWRRNVRRVGATKGPSGMVVAWCFSERYGPGTSFDCQPDFQWLYDLKPRSIIRPTIEVGEWWLWHLLVPFTPGRSRYMSIFRMSETSKISYSSSTFKLIICFLQPVFCFPSPGNNDEQTPPPALWVIYPGGSRSKGLYWDVLDWSFWTWSTQSWSLDLKKKWGQLFKGFFFFVRILLVFK